MIIIKSIRNVFKTNMVNNVIGRIKKKKIEHL